jgi:uncharacterized protein (TIGR04255 family)
MKSSRHYTKAPITEAIIDLRVQLPEITTVADIRHCYEEEEKVYPQRNELNLTFGQIEVGPRISTATSSQQIGFRFASDDQKYVFQARLNGFTLSRLAPYENWDTLRNEAQRLWSAYRHTLKPVKIERLAVRYINRLDLPGERIELKDYVRTAPEVSADLPQLMVGFFLQVSLFHDDIKCISLLNETLVEPPHPGVVAVVLDIDLFRAEDVPQEEEGIWRLFETLHDRKNEVFEACITDRTRELIQ